MPANIPSNVLYFSEGTAATYLAFKQTSKLFTQLLETQKKAEKVSHQERLQFLRFPGITW